VVEVLHAYQRNLYQIKMTALNEKPIFGAQLVKNGFKLSAPSFSVMFALIFFLFFVVKALDYQSSSGDDQGGCRLISESGILT
jgi:hypothetical protein